MTEWEDPRQVLRRHGLAPKKKYSQNFLIARQHAERIAELATRAGVPVVELGPGLGTLTALLLARGANVHAVERDPEMIRVLMEELGTQPRLVVAEGDAVTVDLGELARQAGGKIAVTGNLPYSVTGGIFRNLIRHAAVVERAVVMVQREVRDRLVAKPGTKAYGALGIFVGAAFRVTPAIELSAGCFHPPPKVSSSVVLLEPREGTSWRAEDRSFSVVVNAAFQQRRKTLRNALTAAASPEAVDVALSAAGIDGKRRGETLSIDEFWQLAQAWDGPHGVRTPP